MKAAQHPTNIDVQHAASLASHLSGDDALSNYARLLHETGASGGAEKLHWSASFAWRSDGAGQKAVWLDLRIHTRLAQVCQRCLGQVLVALQVERTFRFVETEQVALTQDEQSEEDLLVTSRAFDLLALIEDEVLLALPWVPMHEVCPEPVKMAAADVDFVAPADPGKAFAVLARLKS